MVNMAKLMTPVSEAVGKSRNLSPGYMLTLTSGPWTVINNS